jgi:hypothetical protein
MEKSITLNKRNKTLILLILTIFGSIISYATDYIKSSKGIVNEETISNANSIALNEWVRNRIKGGNK